MIVQVISLFYFHNFCVQVKYTSHQVFKNSCRTFYRNIFFENHFLFFLQLKDVLNHFIFGSSTEMNLILTFKQGSHTIQITWNVANVLVRKTFYWVRRRIFHIVEPYQIRTLIYIQKSRILLFNCSLTNLPYNKLLIFHNFETFIWIKNKNKVLQCFIDLLKTLDVH